MKRSVFVFSKKGLFCEGILCLLKQQPELQIVGQESNVAAALQCIQETHPDIVMVERSAQVDPCPLMNQILSHDLGSKIITYSLDENDISVIYGERKSIERVDDLIQVLANP